MTTPSALEETGISIAVYESLVSGSQAVGNYTAIVSKYSHNISSNGGYISASITINGNHNFVEDWLQNGLGRHIVVYGAGLQVIWEGFVNQLDINMGYTTFSVGPLVNIANRVSAIYTPIYYRCPEIGDPLYDPACVETGEMITGSTTENAIVEDTVSQDKYGIWEKVLNIGQNLTEDAEYIRDLYLVENAYPETNPSLSLSGSTGELSVTLNCRGYIDWLSNYVYNDETDSVSVLCSALIKTILAADPNDVISTDYSKINENLALHQSQFTENKLAKTIIDDILSFGGGNDERWTFGIYARRQAVYSAIPTEIEYVYYNTGRTQQVETMAGIVLQPWEVIPCKWVAIPTFLIGSNFSYNNIRTDPRVFFAEEVTYTAPDEINVSGAKVRKLTQYMAKLGLGGV